MDKLPIELLAEIFSHLSTTNEQRQTEANHTNDQQRHEDRPNAKDFNIRRTGRALVATASRSLAKICSFNLSSHPPLKVRRSEANSQQHADIFNVRLTTRVFASAAAYSFVEHIKSHPWKFNAESLTRLSNLLRNAHVAQHTTRLRLHSYRFTFPRQFVHPYTRFAHEKIVQARCTYLENTITTQLICVFSLAQHLTELTITPEWYSVCETHHEQMLCDSRCTKGVQSHEANIFKDIADIPNPLQFLSTALESTHTAERLERCTIFTHFDTHFLDNAPQNYYKSSLACINITHLTIDPAYLMDATFWLHCPNLQSLEIMHVEKWLAYRPQTVHERHVPLIEAQRLTEMMGNVKRVVLTGTCGPSLRTSDLYSLVAYITRYTASLETLTIRRAEILNNDGENISYRIPKDGAGKRLDDLRDVRDFRIGVLRLEDLNCWKKMEFVDGGRGLVDVVDNLEVLRGFAQEVVVCVGRE